jgi:radical SAM superfamily enzyme YgiQ (UPF0313 family)
MLLSLDWTRPKDPPLSLGHASILSNLYANSVEVYDKSWSINNASFDPNEVVSVIMENVDRDTDIAIGAFVWGEKTLKHIISRLEHYRFPGRIILGGPQISYLKKGLEEVYPEVDVFIRGYAESAMVDLMTVPLNKTIKGVHYAGQQDLGLTASVALEKLPPPYLSNLIPAQPFIRWETQRGCPFRCSFCQHREPDEAFARRKHLSIDRITEEANWILRNPVINDIAVLDPTFNVGLKYLNVLRALKGYQGKLSLQCRIEMVTDEFLDEVQTLNRGGARVVLEFGLQTIHKLEQKLIERPNNMKKVDRILDEVQARGIECEISLIFGLPQQTVESFHASVQYCLDKGIQTIHAFPLMLLRGTKLHEDREKHQLVESDQVSFSEDIPRVYRDIPHVGELCVEHNIVYDGMIKTIRSRKLG